MADDRDDVEREHTTVVETGGGGGGGSSRRRAADHHRAGPAVRVPWTTWARSQHARHSEHGQRERQSQLIEGQRGRVASPRPPRGRGSIGAAPVCLCGAERFNPRAMADSLRYMTGFGAPFRKRSGARRAAQGPQFAAAARRSGSTPSSCRGAASPRRGTRTAGHGCTGCARPPITGRYVRYEGAPLFAPGTVKEPLAPNRLRWDPPADLPEGADFVDGMVTMLANRDPADLEGVAVHLYRASQEHGAARVRRCRRRTADHSAVGHAPHRHRIRPAGRRAGHHRGHSARREIPGRGRWRKPRLCRREPRPAAAASRSLGRSARTVLPIRAISRRRSPGSRTRTSRPRSSRSRSGHCGPRPSIIRRSTWSPGTAISRPIATICRAST